MSKRRDRHICVFKRGGIWWEHRQYFRNGEWRNCYAPKRGYEALFSRKPLTFDEIDAHIAKQDAKYEKRAAERVTGLMDGRRYFVDGSAKQCEVVE